MAQSLPSLASLRSFEASARLESFSKAAQELNLTQAAISQQIRLLEERVGGALFTREARKVSLTELGRLYLSLTVESLRTMESAFETARALSRPDALILKTTPTFAACWLLPRLHKFQELWPHASLTVTAVEPGGNFESVGDLVITTGQQDQWRNFESQKLFDIELVAVASPAVAQRTDLGRFLAGHTDGIIHTIRRLDDWALWCKGAGIPQFTLDRGTILFNSALSYVAAQNGLGIVIAEEMMIADQLINHDLVRVHSARVSTTRAYYIVELKDRARRPIVDAFARWVSGEITESRQRLDDARVLG
jgi:LysR family transcriptional regulator, glycine cleavage system transcriptional activator